MAGVYSLAKVTVTTSGTNITMGPPDITGTLKLDASGGYTLDVTGGGAPETDSGTFTVSDSTIAFFSHEGGSDTGTISDGGRKITITGAFEGMVAVIEFVRT
jgi:hypothetical protein